MIKLVKDQEKLCIFNKKYDEKVVKLNNGIFVKEQIKKISYFVGTVIAGNDVFKKGDIVKVSYDETYSPIVPEDVSDILEYTPEEKFYRNIIKSLRKNTSLTPIQLKNHLKLPHCITDYEEGRADPTEETLQKIADYFHCSYSYIIGKTNNPNFDIIDNDNFPESMKDMDIQLVVDKGFKISEELCNDLLKFLDDARKEIIDEKMDFDL